MAALEHYKNMLVNRSGKVYGAGRRLPTFGRDRALFRPVRCGSVFAESSRTRGFTEPLKGLGPLGDMG